MDTKFYNDLIIQWTLLNLGILAHKIIEIQEHFILNDSRILCFSKPPSFDLHWIQKMIFTDF